MTEIEELKEEIKDMRREMGDLVDMLVGKMTGWIAEDAAARMVGLAPKTFRERVKAHSLPIHFTCNQGKHNTGYKYRLQDIKDYLLNNSTAA